MLELLLGNPYIIHTATYHSYSKKCTVVNHLLTMSHLTKIALTDEQRAMLEKAYKFGKVHGFRQRCLMILLKAQQKTSREIAEQLGCCMVSVNAWGRRYQRRGH